MNDATILIVDDESALLLMLRTVFEKEGFTRIDTATTAEQALSACQQNAYDLIIPAR